MNITEAHPYSSSSSTKQLELQTKLAEVQKEAEFYDSTLRRSLASDHNNTFSGLLIMWVLDLWSVRYGLSHPEEVEEFSEDGLCEPGEVTVSIPPSEVGQYGAYPH